jgi:hypothetical protein
MVESGDGAGVAVVQRIILLTGFGSILCAKDAISTCLLTCVLLDALLTPPRAHNHGTQPALV